MSRGSILRIYTILAILAMTFTPLGVHIGQPSRAIAAPVQQDFFGEDQGIKGFVRHAETGQALPGAVISIPATGQISIADEGGFYSLDGVPSGYVEIVAELDGFIPDGEIVFVPEGESALQVFALSPALEEGLFRIVLTWGPAPRDLDSHLWIPSAGRMAEVFFADRGSLGAPPFAALDVDDTSGYGPETVTIARGAPGRCLYAVHNFSGDLSIAASGARVIFLQGDRVVQAFTPPPGDGRWWHVLNFDCDSGAIETVNAWSNTPPTASVIDVPSAGARPITPTPLPPSIQRPPPTAFIPQAPISPPPSVRSTGSITGLVRNAANGSPLPGAIVSAQGQTALAGGDGRYQIDGLTAGVVQVSASAPGFIPDMATIAVSPGASSTQVFALSQVLAAGQTRIVLTWGDTPRDLDSHLWVPSAGRVDEISFSNTGSLSGAPFAALDVDDMNSFGPETITVAQTVGGQCTYAVHNYSGESPISTSGARVVVYRGNTILQSFTVPSGSGTWWHVFSFDCQGGSIAPLNQISSRPPSVTGGPVQSPTGAAPVGSCSFTGNWSSNWGRMTLTQVGNSVTGNYEHDQGRITGVVQGNILTGTWSEAPSYAPPSDAGDAQLTLSADCGSITGQWRYGSSGSWGGWNATRIR